MANSQSAAEATKTVPKVANNFLNNPDSVKDLQKKIQFKKIK